MRVLVRMLIPKVEREITSRHVRPIAVRAILTLFASGNMHLTSRVGWPIKVGGTHYCVNSLSESALVDAFVPSCLVPSSTRFHTASIDRPPHECARFLLFISKAKRARARFVIVVLAFPSGTFPASGLLRIHRSSRPIIPQQCNGRQ